MKIKCVTKITQMIPGDESRNKTGSISSSSMSSAWSPRITQSTRAQTGGGGAGAVEGNACLAAASRVFSARACQSMKKVGEKTRAQKGRCVPARLWAVGAPPASGRQTSSSCATRPLWAFCGRSARISRQNKLKKVRPSKRWE